MRFIYILLVILSCFFCNCHSRNSAKETLVYTERNSDNKIIKQVYKYIRDTIDFRVLYYYPNGIEKNIFYLKSDNKHGLEENYYSNGKIQKRGSWYNGRKLGSFYYYDSLGQIQAIRNYIFFRDSNISKMNEVIKFTPKGDTNRFESLYYKYYSKKDTISKNEEYFFTISLNGHIYDNAIVSFCDYDEEYRLKSKSCDTFRMFDFKRSFSPKEYLKGKNIVTGAILNYDTISGKYVEVHFTHDFYVK